jgi:hypothetical protein
MGVVYKCLLARIIRACMYVCMCACIMHTSVYAYVYMHMCIYVCMCVCMYIRGFDFGAFFTFTASILALFSGEPQGEVYGFLHVYAKSRDGKCMCVCMHIHINIFHFLEVYEFLHVRAEYNEMVNVCMYVCIST